VSDNLLQMAAMSAARVSEKSSLLRTGVVVHPSRDIDRPLRDLLDWAGHRGVDVVQILVAGQERRLIPQGDAGDCDLIVSIGGDGTMLAAMRAGVPVDRPVLGVACGSLGVLTTIEVGQLSDALDRFSRRDWAPRRLPSLQVSRGDGGELFALNDIAISRAGIGQLRVTAHADGILFGRLAGDGCIVSTPVGSSAYALAAGGPLLAPETDAYLLTPLPTHGGSCPPLVVGADSRVRLDISAGRGGARLEVDGQIADANPRSLTVSFRRAVSTLVSFPDQEPVLARLRRRGIILDSPRIRAESRLD
jgi:NAD+ kinase